MTKIPQYSTISYTCTKNLNFTRWKRNVWVIDLIFIYFVSICFRMSSFYLVLFLFWFIKLAHGVFLTHVYLTYEYLTCYSYLLTLRFLFVCFNRVVLVSFSFLIMHYFFEKRKIWNKFLENFPQLCLFHKHSVTPDSAHLTPRAALCGSAALSPLAGMLQADVAVVLMAWCHFRLPKQCLHSSDQMLLPLMIPWVPKFLRLFLFLFFFFAKYVFEWTSSVFTEVRDHYFHHTSIHSSIINFYFLTPIFVYSRTNSHFLSSTFCPSFILSRAYIACMQERTHNRTHSETHARARARTKWVCA